MDRLPQILARGIVFCGLLVAISMVGLLFHLWLGGPGPRGGARDRTVRPILINEPDGSITDLNLKLELLERRLGEGDLRAKGLADDLGAARKENEKLAARVRLLEGEVIRLRKLLPPPPGASPAVPGATGAAPGATDGGGN